MIGQSGVNEARMTYRGRCYGGGGRCRDGLCTRLLTRDVCGLFGRVPLFCARVCLTVHLIHHHEQVSKSAFDGIVGRPPLSGRLTCRPTASRSWRGGRPGSSPETGP